MTTPEEIKSLEHALAAARESLAAEQAQQPAQQPDTGGKTAPLAAPPEHALDIRALIAEELRSQAQQPASTPRGLEASAVREAVKEALQGQDLTAGLDIKAIVAEELARYRSPRKTPLATPADGAASDGGQGYKGGGAYIPQHHLGEKGTFNDFLCAIGRKDGRTIHDIQVAHGLIAGTGGKALVEGSGALDGTAGPSGGFLVPPEFSQELIPLLYPYVVVRRAGARVFTMRAPQFFRPRLTGGATANYVGETAAIPVSQQTFDQFSLLAKTLTAMVPISRFLVEDSDPAVADIVRQDAAMQIGLKEDSTFLYGVGSSTVPQGIVTLSGTQSVAATGTNGDAVTYDVVVDMETLLDAANIPNINRCWLCHPRMRGALRKVKDSQGRPIFEDYMNPQNGTVNGPTPSLMGHPVYMTTQIPLGTTGTGATTDLILVEMSEVVIGQLGTMEIASSDEASFVDGSSNTVSAFQSNLTIFRVITRHDINMTHPTALCRRRGLLY